MTIRASEEIEKVNSLFEYKYIKHLRFTLRLMGGWPDHLLDKNKRKHRNYQTYLLLFVKVITAVGGLMYIKSHSSSLPFMEIGHNYITVFMTFVTISRLATLCINPKYHELMKKFLTDIHLYFYKDESEYALRTHVKVHKMSTIFCHYLRVLVILGTVLFNSLPIYNNYRNGKYDSTNPNQKDIPYVYAIYYDLPFDPCTNKVQYIVVSLFNWYSTYICASVICSIDLVVFILIFHIRGHYKILLYKLNNFSVPSTCGNNEILRDAQLFNDKEMIEIGKRLKHCISYHKIILAITNEISSVFGPMLFVYYTFHQISDCLLLLVMSQMNITALIRYGPLTLSLFQQLIQLSFIVESIGTVSGKLKDAVYCLPWQYMDLKNKRLVVIFMMNVAEPVHINALGLAKVGVTSMASILKTSLSYFAFLRSAAD